MNLEDIESCIVYALNDNSEWEYTREGIGIYNGRVFLVDLDDTGEEERKLLFVKEGMQVHQVLAIGKATGRYEQEPSGKFWYNWNKDGNRDSVRAFCVQTGLAVPNWAL